ncbi:MAG: peptide ABC transporter substrate-binding protein [Caldilineaceae bacterium]
MQDWTKDPRQVALFMNRSRAAGMDRRDFLKLLAVAGTGAALAACAPAAAPSGGEASAPAAGGEAAPAAGAAVADAEQVMRVPWANGDPSSQDFNKYLYCNGHTELFAGLTRFNTDYQPVPYVAEKWDVSEDGTVYTFHLKQGLKWTNGDPVTAQDFEWSFKRQLDPATQAEYAGFLFDVKNGEAVNTGKEGAKVEDIGVKALDANTLEITLEGPRGYFPTVLAYAAALPAHRPSVEKFGEKWTEAENIVTNGPWKLTSWEHEKEMVFERYEEFQLETKAKLRKIIAPIIGSDAQLAPYEAGELDRAQASAGELSRLQGDEALSKELYPFSVTGTFYLAPSYSMPPFDVKEVRQALRHAIDRDAILKSVLQGLGQVAYTFVPPDSPGYVDPAKYDWVKDVSEYNPQRAMDLLKGTPYEGGKNWPEITITFRNDEFSGTPGQVAQAMQAMLKQNLGMEVKLEGMENKAFRPKMWAHEVQLVYVRWFMDYPDPNNNLKQVWYSNVASGHRHEFANEEFDKLVNEAAGAPTWDDRMKLYAEAEKLMLEDGAAVYIYYPFNIRLYKPWIAGLPKNSAGLSVQDWNIYFGLLNEVYVVEHPDRPKLS